MMSIVIGICFTLTAAVCAISTLLGLPGIWLMIALAGVIDLIDVMVFDQTISFGWVSLLIAFLLAMLGEFLEFMAGAAGAKAGGANRRGIIGALIGGFFGGIAGTFIIPIPLIGTFVGAAIGAGLGAFIGEITKAGATITGSLKPAGGAAAGRVAGTLSKTIVAAITWIALSIAVFI